MKHFTIENETNNITIYASAKEADAVPDSERFGSEAALAKLAANWPAARLIEIWNSLSGTFDISLRWREFAATAARETPSATNLSRRFLEKKVQDVLCYAPFIGYRNPPFGVQDLRPGA